MWEFRNSPKSAKNLLGFIVTPDKGYERQSTRKKKKDDDSDDDDGSSRKRKKKKRKDDAVVLKVTVKSAKGLKDADWIGSSDPYCVVEIPSSKKNRKKRQTSP